MLFKLKCWVYHEEDKNQGAVRRIDRSDVYHVCYDNKWFNLRDSKLGKVIHLFNTQVGKNEILRKEIFPNGLRSISVLSQTLETTEPCFQIEGRVMSLDDIMSRAFVSEYASSYKKPDKKLYNNLDMFGIF